MADPGERPGGGLVPSLFLDQTEARRKKILETVPPPPPSLAQGLDDRTPPLSQGLDSALILNLLMK